MAARSHLRGHRPTPAVHDLVRCTLSPLPPTIPPNNTDKSSWRRYGCVPAEQHTFSNLCIDADNAVLLEARALGMRGMKSVTWAFFMNAVPPRSGLMLRPDYQAGWADMWHGSGALSALSANQTVMGVFLGDELLGAGINVTELTIAAETVKASWREGIVYWNEEWGPVVQNSSWARPASALHSVPHAIDWISLDFYRTNPTAWETPEQEYAAQVYPKMHPHQRALQVPQAFGRKHDACAAVCYMNASQRGCCKDNHGPGKPWASGQSNHTREWWDDWSATVATNYYSWAQRDPKIIGINPWYYGEDRGDIACGGYNVSVRQQPKAMARWKEIGVAILANA